MAQNARITRLKAEGSLPRGVTSGSAPTRGGVPDCRPAALRRTAHVSSRRTLLIPLSNLTCGHLILLARRVTSVYLAHLDWPVQISTCSLQGFLPLLPSWRVSFPAGRRRGRGYTVTSLTMRAGLTWPSERHQQG